MIRTEHVAALAMETIAPPPPIEEQPEGPVFPLLTPKDRCDHDCPQQALVRMKVGDKALDFCRHHYNKNEMALIEQGAEIVQMIFLYEGAPGVGI
jgi:hypothetical protein